MYMKYNLVLRGMGAGRHTKIHEEYERVCKLNTYAPEHASNIVQAAHDPHLLLSPLPPLLRYTTTLHVINSAIIKLSKLTSATKLYRGVSGALLPRPFWTPNQYNVRGGVEVAFMSCTEDKEVALKYAAPKKKAAIVFEVKQGMVDRGADVAWLRSTRTRRVRSRCRAARGRAPPTSTAPSPPPLPPLSAIPGQGNTW